MAFPSNIGRIVIAGVGLIGGSIGLALKYAGFQGKIVGLGRRWSSLKRAIEAGAVDSAEIDFAEALRDADILILCTPVDTIVEIMGKAIQYLPQGCIITDAGSTKASLVHEIESLIPDGIHFVGGHPMAGSDESGVVSAKDDLFRGRICILTPTEKTDGNAIQSISEMWQTMGASVNIMPPDDHDYLIGAASHLPHAVTCALVNVVSSIENKKTNALDFASTGFADTTRIAMGSPEIWRGIFQQNAENVALMISKMEAELSELKGIIENKDGDALIKKLNQARDNRMAFSKSE